MYFGSMSDDTIYTILKDAIQGVESEMDEKNKEITRLTGQLCSANFLLRDAKFGGISQLLNGPYDDPFMKKVGVIFTTKLSPETPVELFEKAVKRRLEEFQDDKR